MKIVKNLQFLENQAIRSLRKSVQNLPVGVQFLSKREQEEKITFGAINLLNTWATFQRSYFVCCLMGARSKSGHQITSSVSGSISSINRAIGEAIPHFKPSAIIKPNGEWDTRDEPAWHDANTILRLSSLYSFSNNTTITNAYTLGYTAHKNLVVFRNYYGHKNRGTRAKAQVISIQYLIPEHLHPSDALLEPPYAAKSSSLIQMWTDELVETVQMQCI
jgi:hypothetical protein